MKPNWIIGILRDGKIHTRVEIEHTMHRATLGMDGAVFAFQVDPDVLTALEAVVADNKFHLGNPLPVVSAEAEAALVAAGEGETPQ